MPIVSAPVPEEGVRASIDESGRGLGLLVVDDHAIVREGLKRMLDASNESWHVVEATDGFDALARLRAGGIDVAIVDISMPGMGGLDFLRRARQEFPALRILMLSMYAEEQYALRSLKSGANGYLTKDCAPRELVAAIRKVVGGGNYISSSLADRMVHSLQGGQGELPHSRLSDRELEVLRRLASGQRPTDIAKDLHLSIKTISTYKSRILEHLQLSSTAALVRYAMEHGLVEAAPPPGPTGE
jgi:DNA-binding NarL/FixJ family response regulator